MQRDLIRSTLLALTFGMLIVSCGYVILWQPSRAGELSVAENGEFLSGTYHRNSWFWRNSLRLWSSDLSHSRLVPCQTGINIGGHFAFSPDGKTIAINTRTYDGSAVLGLDTSGRVAFLRAVDGSGTQGLRLKYSSDGKRLLLFNRFVEGDGYWKVFATDLVRGKSPRVLLPIRASRGASTWYINSRGVVESTIKYTVGSGSGSKKYTTAVIVEFANGQIYTATSTKTVGTSSRWTWVSAI